MKEVVRCKHCRLNQFMTIDEHCRKCHQSFTPAAAPVTIPVGVPVLVAEPDVSVFKASAANFSKVFRVCRLAMGWSQREMADLVKVSRTYISKLERQGVTPTIATLYRLADVFKVTPVFFCMMAEGQDD